MWVANLADLELHRRSRSRADIERPTIAGASTSTPGRRRRSSSAREVALRLRDAVRPLGLRGFPKTSGSKGMQVYVPLNTPTSPTTTPSRSPTRSPQLLESREPELVVSDMRKELRGGKVFVDWSQNDEHKTTVGVYSLRAASARRSRRR